MASSTSAAGPQLYSYMAILPDFEDSKRMDVRPIHLEDAKKSHAQGILQEGGALFAGDLAKEDGSAKMNGSFMLFKAENLEKAREWLEADIYAKGGAWDMSKAQIYSVKVAQH